MPLAYKPIDHEGLCSSTLQAPQRLDALLGSKERLDRLLEAPMYWKPYDVLTVETKTLVRDCLDRITFSPINSGTVMSPRGRRGRSTFASVADYPFEEHRKRRPGDPLVELAVDYGVENICRHVVRVERRRGPSRPRPSGRGRGGRRELPRPRAGRRQPAARMCSPESRAAPARARGRGAGGA